MIDSYLEVLKQYEGEAISVRRGRGAWICEYPDGLRLLKEYRGTQKRLEFVRCRRSYCRWQSAGEIVM